MKEISNIVIYTYLFKAFSRFLFILMAVSVEDRKINMEYSNLSLSIKFREVELFDL